MSKHSVETTKPIEPLASSSMNAQETPVARLVTTAHGLRLNPEYLKNLAAEHQEGLTYLAENDGPVLQEKGTASR